MHVHDALIEAWRILAAVPKHLWATTLFFRVPRERLQIPQSYYRGREPNHWRPLRDADVLGFVHDAARAAGLDPAKYGVRALRMGGATDLYDLFGPAGERYIRERGRWASDVAQIYQRVSAATHGMLSRTIGDSVGPDLQSLLAGWCQTAASHGRCPA